MTEWKRVEGDVEPLLLDTISSPDTVYMHRNITQEDRTDMDGNTYKIWAYDEQTYTREEYNQLISPATVATRQQMTDIELAILELDIGG